MKKLLIILLLSFANLALAECAKTNLRYIYQHQMKNESVNFCFNEQTGNLVGKCQKNCLAKSLIKREIKKEQLFSVFGSPYFKICEVYEGTPRIIEIFLQKRWQKTSVCVFEDESFIDNASLLGTLDP